MMSSPSDSSLLPEVVDVWILVHGGDIFFAGFNFSPSVGLQVLASKDLNDAWMFPDEQTATETMREDKRLHTYQVVCVKLKKIPKIYTPPSSSTTQ